MGRRRLTSWWRAAGALGACLAAALGGGAALAQPAGAPPRGGGDAAEGAADDGGDGGDEDGPVVAGPASAQAARAQALFDTGRWAEAAAALAPVAGGATNDGVERRQIAQHHLAIALYRLRFPNASYAVFSVIADARSHARFAEALPWLLRLAEELPEPAAVMERIGRYRGAPAPRGALSYWLGREAYRTHAYAEAAARFEAVGRGSARYLQAQLFAGVAHVQMRRTEPALRAFRRIVEAADGAAARGARPPWGGDAARMKELALLSIGRTLYSASVHLGRGGAAIDDTALRGALRSFGQVAAWGPSWRESLFEQAWAYFMLGDHPRALGNLHAVEAPYFPGAPYPEADVLRALVALVLCHFDDARAIAVRMVSRYAPVARQLEALIASLAGEGSEPRFFALLEEVRGGVADRLGSASAGVADRLGSASAGVADRLGSASAGVAGLSPDVRAIVEAALSGRDLRRHVAYVAALEAEAARLARAPASFRGSPAGVAIADTLELARDLAIQNAGALVQRRLRRSLGELAGHVRNAGATAVEAGRAGAPPRDRRTARRHAAGAWTRGLVLSSDGYEVWPFDGEYWRDEMGHYQQAVTSRCVR